MLLLLYPTIFLLLVSFLPLHFLDQKVLIQELS